MNDDAGRIYCYGTFRVEVARRIGAEKEVCEWERKHHRRDTIHLRHLQAIIRIRDWRQQRRWRRALKRAQQSKPMPTTAGQRPFRIGADVGGTFTDGGSVAYVARAGGLHVGARSAARWCGFLACEQDLSHQPPDAPLPEAVARRGRSRWVVGAIAGG